ncbi:MFS transporter [Arcobacter porcinus]|uniref:Inner membrane transport protein YnfM n=1 Tax=Arcobacter porcinus TaxID=1935204 RepID=A0A1C0AYL2_9BACT|nr:MFS transporter [Arcobacter porcinus]OCL94554.1 Inner membrane transport protein YnfM [Aliarcobacter thereius]OCL83153.1 Inner membrane transport protein YnfM [Arcobacter porcinus]OCL83355.1 Inner membrane transport protein YnfM [Arcobacter porcinus]OCL88128.1 Inner membrane transport protein YnfM [Arcobacter porcinus]OCL92587.1 Inner membrane transport protein YnfM [Arcobacter porcinus]
MKTNLLIIVYSIIVVLSVMYATQPIQPLLAREFDISVIEASQFTAIVLLFMAISPIIYGYFLEKMCPKKMLINASIILLVTNICLGLSRSFESFMIFRTLEALVVPAVLTSLMSILASIDKENIKFNMSVYVAATVFGGLVGRIFSGFIATNFSYTYVFYSLSFAIFISILLIRKLDFDGEANILKPKFEDIKNILKDKRFLLIYFLMFCVFFVFAGVLNVLPFRAKEISENFSEFQISLLYLGYGMGILVSLNSKKITNFFKGDLNTIIVSTIFFTIICFTLFTEDIIYLFILLFLLCVGMFTTHTVSTQLANSMKSSQKSLTSGMYLSFYYLGGAMGSFFPSIIYKSYGWDIMIWIFGAILIVVLYVLMISKKRLSKAS